MINIINSLPEMRNNPINSAQIDISHPLKSERKDRKNVGVIRFVHRKTKIRVLEAKRKAGNFDFENQAIYINDHLSIFNRGLFAKASDIKRSQGYKYLWVKNGYIFMRKTDRSGLIRVTSYGDLSVINPVADTPEGGNNG